MKNVGVIVWLKTFRKVVIRIVLFELFSNFYIKTEISTVKCIGSYLVINALKLFKLPNQLVHWAAYSLKACKWHCIGIITHRNWNRITHWLQGLQKCAMSHLISHWELNPNKSFRNWSSTLKSWQVSFKRGQTVKDQKFTWRTTYQKNSKNKLTLFQF